MILYHYSNNNFENFEIKKEFLNTQEENLQEGLGVYLSDNKEAFKNYGQYCYIVECNDIYNFTNIKNIYKVLYDFLKVYDTNKLILRSLKNHRGIKEYLDGIKNGNYSITNCIKNLWLYLEEEIHGLNVKFDLYEYESFLLEDWNKFLEKRVIKYYDNNFRCCVFIAKNTNNIKIIGGGKNEIKNN